jgi:hypothetical protein
LGAEGYVITVVEAKPNRLTPRHCSAGFFRPLLATRTIRGNGVAAPKPIDLPNAATGLRLHGLEAIMPLKSLVGAKHAVPDIHGYAEVVMPLIVCVVNKVNWHRQPETLCRILMLELVRKR